MPIGGGSPSPATTMVITLVEMYNCIKNGHCVNPVVCSKDLIENNFMS
jgi:hypothetical protein